MSNFLQNSMYLIFFIVQTIRSYYLYIFKYTKFKNLLILTTEKYSNLKFNNIKCKIIENATCKIRYSTALKTLRIIDTKAIPFECFEENKNLQYIEFDECLEKILDFAFSKCRSILYIKLPKNIKYIGKCAFNDCINLILIDIPKTCIQIDQYAFNNCVNLQKIVFY